MEKEEVTSEWAYRAARNYRHQLRDMHFSYGYKIALTEYKISLKKAIEQRIDVLRADKKNMGFTDEQNYIFYAVITELQMTLELMDTVLPPELCPTCGHLQENAGLSYCSDSFHLPTKKL